MTTIENPMTEKTNGSSRMTTNTDAPWWLVRPSLAVGLLGSFALALGVFRLAGMAGRGTPISTHSVAGAMQWLSATPTLVGLGLVACMILVHRSTRPALRMLCGLLALASFAGAGMNATRDSHGRGPIEAWAEKAISELPGMLAGK